MGPSLAFIEASEGGNESSRAFSFRTSQSGCWLNSFGGTSPGAPPSNEHGTPSSSGLGTAAATASSAAEGCMQAEASLPSSMVSGLIARHTASLVLRSEDHPTKRSPDLRICFRTQTKRHVAISRNDPQSIHHRKQKNPILIMQAGSPSRAFPDAAAPQWCDSQQREICAGLGPAPAQAASSPTEQATRRLRRPQPQLVLHPPQRSTVQFPPSRHGAKKVVPLTSKTRVPSVPLRPAASRERLPDV
mmetsp:Transcript_41018/g.128009  ORF Transcript_41018/g.128009 Transcript_41018/m.128009 type:complete len:246 (+) Transcript_41018:349-1086(+)